MTRKEIINDLKIIKEHFKMYYNDCYPASLDYAIEYLTRSKGKTLEVEEYKEEDFMDELPFQNIYDDNLPF